ncbi:hypothetical protein Emag_006047 [Eimeria magna]
MGVVIRGKLSLGLSLSDLIWKPMVNLNPSPRDLEATDALNSQILQKVLDLEKEGIDEETFADVFPLTWSTTSADGEVVALKETGGDDPVSWGERETYVAKALAFKLAEGQMQTCALRQGLGEVVPLQVTDLLGPQQLERLVCGSPAIDLKLLKSHTRYSGYSVTDKEIEWFWQALESFSTLERQQFLRFVWGRSRLPAAHAAWEQEMEVAMKAPVRPAAAAPTGAAGAAAAGAADANSPRTITTPASGERVVATYSPTFAAAFAAVAADIAATACLGVAAELCCIIAQADGLDAAAAGLTVLLKVLFDLLRCCRELQCCLLLFLLLLLTLILEPRASSCCPHESASAAAVADVLPLRCQLGPRSRMILMLLLLLQQQQQQQQQQERKQQQRHDRSRDICSYSSTTPTNLDGNRQGHL